MSEGILFSRLLKTASAVPVFKYAGEKPSAKNYLPVTLLSVVKKKKKKVVNNSLVGHLGLFSDIQYGFRSF